jgi:uncharacterized protein YlxW (UPF0749 family)
LKQRAAEQQEAAVRAAREEAVAAEREQAQQHAAELQSVRADAARAEQRLKTLKQELAAARPAAERGAVGPLEPRRDAVHPEGVAEAQSPVVTRRRMAEITGGLVLAGFAGTLIGWIVALSRSLY